MRAYQSVDKRNRGYNNPLKSAYTSGPLEFVFLIKKVKFTKKQLKEINDICIKVDFDIKQLNTKIITEGEGEEITETEE